MSVENKVLLVDDEPEILSFLQMMFTENLYGVHTASSGQDALRLFDKEDIEVMVSDIRMPGMNGIELMHHAKKKKANLQCVFMSGHSDIEIAVKAMKAGAINFLLKPVDFDAVEASVSHAFDKIKLLKTIQEKDRELTEYYTHLESLVHERTATLKRLNQELENEILNRVAAEKDALHKANHAPLTSLPNRLLFHDRLELALAHANRHQERVALCMLDLNGFKKINDTLGHAAGDKLLREVANRLSSSLRKSDTVARMGGDEFTIILPQVRSKEDTEHLAGKIVGLFERPWSYHDHDIRISTSIGVALYPRDGTEVESLLHAADVAMYCNKHKTMQYLLHKQPN